MLGRAILVCSLLALTPIRLEGAFAVVILFILFWMVEVRLNRLRERVDKLEAREKSKHCS